MDLVSRRSLRAAVVGMVLGNAHIRAKRYTLAIRHSVRQEAYLRYKAGLLEQLQQSPIRVMRFHNSGYPGVRIETQQHPLYRRLYQLFYEPGGEKRVTRKVLDYLDPRGIAIWYMDDGSVSAKRRRGKVHAYELRLNTYLPRDENELIIQYFAQVWGVRFGLNLSKGRWRLRMGTRQARQFAQLVAPYIISTMRRKIDPLLV
jgi:hypothetical protein